MKTISFYILKASLKVLNKSIFSRLFFCTFQIKDIENNVVEKITKNFKHMTKDVNRDQNESNSSSIRFGFSL